MSNKVHKSWNEFIGFVGEEEGSGTLEKVAIIGAIAVPLLVTLYFIADKVTGIVKDQVPKVKPVESATSF